MILAEHQLSDTIKACWAPNSINLSDDFNPIQIMTERASKNFPVEPTKPIRNWTLAIYEGNNWDTVLVVATV